MHQFFGGEVCAVASPFIWLRRLWFTWLRRLFGFAAYELRCLWASPIMVYGLRRLRASLFMGFAV
ncbi:hypothetical protein KI659_18040, partial [Litoribacter alkaliphilus]